jgi:hypothetical protein
MKEHAVGQGTKVLDTDGFLLLTETENIDSGNCLPREKSCMLIVGHRLFQQHRPEADQREA